MLMVSALVKAVIGVTFFSEITNLVRVVANFVTRNVESAWRLETSVEPSAYFIELVSNCSYKVIQTEVEMLSENDLELALRSIKTGLKEEHSKDGLVKEGFSM